MDVLTHFRSIEELTKTLSREQGLLSEKKKLQNLDEKSHGIRAMICKCEKLMDDEHAFFIIANEGEMLG